MKSHWPNFKIMFVVIFLFGSLGMGKSSWAANWYVDNAAAGSNTGSSWTDAWISFSSVIWGSGGVSAGDTLYISGGSSSKKYTEQMHIGVSGTSGLPITIRVAQDTGHNGEVILDYDALGDSGTGYAFWIYNISNLVIDGSVGAARKLTIKNLRNTTSKTGDVSAAIGAGGNTNVTIRYITVENCNNGIWANGGTNIEVDHNSFQVRGDAAITWFGDDAFDNILIHHNAIELLFNNVPSGYAGPDGIQGGSGLSIYNNTFTVSWTNVTTSTQHPDSCQVTGNHLKIYNNEFINIGDSAIDFDFFSNPTPNNIYIFNNVFRTAEEIDTYPQYFRMYSSTGSPWVSLTNLKILNNTFVDAPLNTNVISVDGSKNETGSGIEIKNNIFYNLAANSNSAALIFTESTNYDSKSFSWANNVYYHPSGMAIYFRGTSYTPAQFINPSTGIDKTGKSSAPTFVSYTEYGASNDLRLSVSDTVAKDAGADLSSLCATVSELCSDKNGVSRPQGSAWDIGAYEYVTGGDTTPPAAPTGLSVR